MKKIRRQLRLHSLKFYCCHNFYPAATPGPTYFCIKRNQNPKQFFEYYGRHEFMPLLGQKLHDMLLEFSLGKSSYGVYLIETGKYNTIFCKTLDDLVDRTYLVDLIMALSGIK